jgi:hypothetical protein
MKQVTGFISRGLISSHRLRRDEHIGTGNPFHALGKSTGTDTVRAHLGTTPIGRGTETRKPTTRAVHDERCRAQKAVETTTGGY